VILGRTVKPADAVRGGDPHDIVTLFASTPLSGPPALAAAGGLMPTVKVPDMNPMLLLDMPDTDLIRLGLSDCKLQL
jgi:hypothetical protein